MFFVPWEFHVKNPEHSRSLTWVMLLVNRWRLPLLFFISGGGVFFSLRRRSFGQFAAERLRRLLLPLVFGMLVVVPPQVYYERLANGQTFPSYFGFWKTVFRFVPYPEGNFTWHHLWFVAYILVFSLVCIPVFAALKSDGGRRLVDGLARLCERPGVVYLLNVPSIALAVWLGPKWPVTHNLYADWANLAGSLTTFLWGFVICGSGRFLDLVERKRKEFTILAFAATVLFYTVRLAAWSRQWSPAERLWTGVLIDSYMGMAWIFALVGWSRARLDRDSRALRYANRAVYPFYIAHQTITVTLGYYMIGWRAPIAVKFPLLAGGTFLGSWAVYELARRTAVTRALMGIKAEPVQSAATRSAMSSV